MVECCRCFSLPEGLPLNPSIGNPGPGVIVLGVFRSGTSLVCQVLHELGVEFGLDLKEIRGNRNNSGGTFEHRQINQINHQLLRSASRSFAQPGSPSTLAQEADLTLLDEGDLSWIYGVQKWGLKDPRFRATLSAWIEAGKLKRDALNIVHGIRDTEAIARRAHKYPHTSKPFGGSFERIREGVTEYKRLAE